MLMAIHQTSTKLSLSGLMRLSAELLRSLDDPQVPNLTLEQAPGLLTLRERFFTPVAICTMVVLRLILLLMERLLADHMLPMVLTKKLWFELEPPLKEKFFH